MFADVILSIAILAVLGLGVGLSLRYIEGVRDVEGVLLTLVILPAPL